MSLGLFSAGGAKLQLNSRCCSSGGQHDPSQRTRSQTDLSFLWDVFSCTRSTRLAFTCTVQINGRAFHNGVVVVSRNAGRLTSDGSESQVSVWFNRSGSHGCEIAGDAAALLSPSRRGGALPDGASAIGGKLVFMRALRLNDSGVYECLVRNNVGEGRTEYTLTVKGERGARGPTGRR